MSNTAHISIRAAMVALISASPALAGITVVANRRRPMPRELDRMVFVYLEDSLATPGEIKGAPTRWDTRIRVECVARDTAGANADTNADALQTAVYGALLANPSLSGQAVDTEPKAIAWTEDEADTTVSACQAIYSVWHQTSGAVVTP